MNNLTVRFLETQTRLRTKRSYGESLRRFFGDGAVDLKEVRAVPAEILVAYLARMLAQGYAPATVKRHFYALRCFYNWLQQQRLIIENPTDGLMPFDPKSPSLFYPCSGGDHRCPVECFSESVTDFFFVDIAYDSTTQVVCRPRGYRLQSESHSTLEGTTIRRRQAYQIDVYTHEFVSQEDRRRLRIHLCRGRGYDVFRSLFDGGHRELAVFFYRGDSMGEGGSGFYWLRSRLTEVLRRLIPGGLIVTDGSNAIGPLATYHRNNDIGEEAAHAAASFKYDGYCFDCVGYVGERYGPTLVWRTRVPNEASGCKEVLVP